MATKHTKKKTSPAPAPAKKQPNALLTFAGEQDAEYLIAALKGVSDLGQEDSGGSREISVRGEGDRIVIGWKKELDT